MATGTLSDLELSDTCCWVCGRSLDERSWRERRRCERQPLPIQYTASRPPRQRWWRSR
jgi:hypothetical protein